MNEEVEPIETAARPLALRREGSEVLTCAECGCRLTARESRADGGGIGPDAAWRHFEGSVWDGDGRGHRVVCVDVPHRVSALATA